MAAVAPRDIRTAGVESWHHALCIERRGGRGCHPRERRVCGRALTMARRWTESEDTAVRLAAALDGEDGGQRLRVLAGRLGRTEAAVRWRAWHLRAAHAEDGAA